MGGTGHRRLREVSGGCLYLISSGRSDRDNFLYAQSEDGNDVFFASPDLLTGSDAGGTVSIYDARVGGGFAEPEAAVCEGEGCRPGLTPPPVLASPALPALGAEDDVKPAKPKRCPKGKHKAKKHGKTVCVKNKQGKGKKKAKAGKSGRAGR